VGLLAGFCPAAGAATVSVRDTTKPGFLFATEVVYVAGPGERNDTVVEAAYAGAPWIVRDAGAVIEPGAGCAALDAHAAGCTAPLNAGMFGGLALADASLGDLEDRIRLQAPDASASFRLFVDGGDGDDTLTGAQGGGALHGGAGDDQLLSPTVPGSFKTLLDGGGGTDELRGGDGPETLTDGDLGAPGPDVLDGGGGRDAVTYRPRTAPVTVDLVRATGGERGERDAVLNVEIISGGRGADRLVGDDGWNDIRGRDGRDTLIGGGDTDFLFNGGGSTACGDGVDYVVDPGLGEFLEPDCENLYTGSEPSYPAYPPVRRRGLRYLVQCPRGDEEHLHVLCSGSLTLRESGGARRVLAAGRSPVGRWERRSYRVPLTAAGRRRAATGRAVRATSVLRIDGELIMRWRIRLELPR
jgi:RTX calcium-binding nonapeptide repeat (4 copies)